MKHSDESMARRISSLGVVGVVVLGALVGLGASCDNRPFLVGARSSGGAASGAGDAHPSLRIYYLVDLDGYLEPCGCQTRPLGGIDRLARILETERARAPRSMLVAAGNLFYAEPVLESRMQWQEAAKAESLVQILEGIRLAAFAPGPADFALGAEDWARLSRRFAARALVANAEGGFGATVLTDEGGLRVGIAGVTDFRPGEGEAPAGAPRVGDPVEAARRATSDLRARGAQVVVVLASVPRRVARSIAAAPGVDFVIAARETAVEARAPEKIGAAYLVTAASQGRRLGVLDLFVRGGGAFQDASEATVVAERARLDARIADLRARLEVWERDPSADRAGVQAQRRRLGELEGERAALAARGATARGRYFRAQALEVAPEVPRLARVEETIGRYFRAVNEHNREAYGALRAPAAPPGTAGYVGIETCRDCHEEAYEVWARTPHAHAYRTLSDLSKNFNLSCVGCHVTGYRRPGGSEVVQNEGLRDVQCESCHGPGGLHVAARTDAQRRATIRRRVEGDFCAGECHTPEHSDHFDFATYLPRILGPGHGGGAAMAPAAPAH